VFLFTRRFQGTTIEIETLVQFLSDKLVRIRPPCCGRRAHCGTTRDYKLALQTIHGQGFTAGWNLSGRLPAEWSFM